MMNTSLYRIFLYTEYFPQHDSEADTDAVKNGKEKREENAISKEESFCSLG